MPSSLAYEIARAQDLLQSTMSDHTTASGAEASTVTLPVFTWRGTDYPCTPQKSVKGKLFGAGGFTLDASCVLVVRIQDIPDPGPQPDQFITYLGDRLRIDTVSTDASGASVTLTCNDPNRGAGIVEREV